MKVDPNYLYVRKALLFYKSNDLEVCLKAFKGQTMDEVWNKSGKTRQQTVDAAAQERLAWQRALEWLDRRANHSDD